MNLVQTIIPYHANILQMLMWNQWKTVKIPWNFLLLNGCGWTYMILTYVTLLANSFRLTANPPGKPNMLQPPAKKSAGDHIGSQCCTSRRPKLFEFCHSIPLPRSRPFFIKTSGLAPQAVDLGPPLVAMWVGGVIPWYQPEWIQPSAGSTLDHISI